MEKIIEPVSYKRMTEKYTQPVHTYGKKTKLTEGYGAGYTLTFLGLKLTNIQVEEPQKDSDGCYTAKFTADIKPGEYHFFADHPMWNLGSYVRESDKNDYLHRDWKPYSVYSYNAVPKAIIDGGKVEGVCDDRGQKWDSWDAADAQPGWTKEDYVREIESEEFCVEEGYGGGWSHTPMEKEITFEAEDRDSYYHGIDLGFNSNDATLTKVTFQFADNWVATYNDEVDRAIYGDEEDDEEDLVTYEVTGIDWDVDNDDDLDDLPYDTSIEVPGNYDEDDVIDALSDEYGFLINGVEGIKRVYESKKSRKARLTERLHKIEHGNGVYGYAEPGEDEWLFLANGYGASKFIGYIAAPSGKVYLKKNAPKEAFDAFPEYELLNSRFDEKASLTPGSFMYPMSYDGYDPLSDFYAIIKDEGYYEGAEYWDGEDFTEDFLDAALYDKKEDAEKELEKLFDIYGKDCPLKISSETVEPYTEKRVREFFGGEWAEPEDDENWDIDDDREDYEGTVADDIAELHYLLDKEKSGMALDSYELRVLQSLIDDYPEEYEQTLNEACIPTDNDPDIADFVSVFHDTLGGSPKKREAAIEELDGIKNSLVKTYPELEGKSPSQIARWCDNVLNGKWNGKLHEDALASEIRQRVNDVNAAKRKVDQDVEILDKKVANATQEMVKLAINHGRNGGLHEAAPRKIEVDFPIHVNKRGLIPEADAKKLLRKLAADHKLRVGSLYEVIDADGKTTTWDFSASTDPGFGYIFGCSSRSEDGEGMGDNSFYLNKKRNKVCLKDAVYVCEYHPNDISNAKQMDAYKAYDESVKSDKKRLQEGAGAGYSIIFKGIELENIKVTESDENVGDKNFHFEADIKPQKYDWSAEGYDWNTGTDWAGEFAKVEVSGKVSGAYYYYDYNGYDFDAKDAEQEIAKEKFDLGDLHYSGGWSHVDVPEHFVLDEDVDLSDERSGYKEAFVQYAELDIDADIVNAFIEDIMYNYGDEDEDFDESKKSNKSKLTEAARYTHRIVLKSDDPDSPTSYRLTHPENLRYRSQEEAQKAIDAYNGASLGQRLRSKGLHLEIEEIPQKKRWSATNDPDYENPFEVGDILEGDFGYSMVLPVWYEVVKVTAKQATLKELASIVVSHDGYGQAGVKRPNIGVYKKDWDGKEKEVKALVKKHKGSWYDKFDDPKKKYYVVISNHIFDIWDGQDASFDTYD